jgi:hypothetical protein
LIVLIIPFGATIGWYIFRNNPGFVATVAFSVAISQVIKELKK